MSAESTCNWNQDEWEGDLWVSECGVYWSLNEGTPTENKMKFCLNCGKPLTQTPYEEEDIEE